MTTTLYITRDGDMIRFGVPAAVSTRMYPDTDLTWVRRVLVELPEGFYVGRSIDGVKRIYHEGDETEKYNVYYALIANADEIPCIIDHKHYGRHIPLRILAEGWDGWED